MMFDACACQSHVTSIHQLEYQIASRRESPHGEGVHNGMSQNCSKTLLFYGCVVFVRDVSNFRLVFVEDFYVVVKMFFLMDISITVCG